MARIRHLARAPISEAVIDLRIQPNEELSMESLTRLAEQFKPGYPLVRKIESFEATLAFGEGRPKTGEPVYSETGVFLKSADECNVVQFRKDGFTFSRLAPYTSWEAVFPDAISLWNRYRELTKTVRVTRLAVRYINRLRFSLPINLPDFFTAPPTVPEPLPQALRGYLTRFILNDGETNNSVIITEALEPSPDAQQAIILLDVDAYRDVDMQSDDKRIHTILGTLRDLKNRVFFGSITERTAEMYE